MAKEWDSAQYDEVYATGGSDKVYDLPYHLSGYYPLFKAVASALTGKGSKSVFEVGCGTGGFAHLWLERVPGASYRGFDFSAVAVDRARARLARSDLFFQADARDKGAYATGFDALVCTEVLEHIDDDLDVVANWAPGTLCVCSVPNFEATNHVRVFTSENQVIDRYSGLIDIETVTRVKKPWLFDLSWGSYARELRWNRYRPRRIVKILGLESFDVAGGWFIFVGRRKP